MASVMAATAARLAGRPVAISPAKPHMEFASPFRSAGDPYRLVVEVGTGTSHGGTHECRPRQ
jgi:hypothetical protein